MCVVGDICSELGQGKTGCSGEYCFGVMYRGWYGVCDFVVLSVVEVCADRWCEWVISSFRSFRAGSQVFALHMLFLCVILHTMSSDKSLQLLCILPFGMLCLSAISMMFVKILLAVCMFLVVGNGLSVLL